MWEVRSSSEIVKCTSAMATPNIDVIYTAYDGENTEDKRGVGDENLLLVFHWCDTPVLTKIPVRQCRTGCDG